jgi:hypothetical protein
MHAKALRNLSPDNRPALHTKPSLKQQAGFLCDVPAMHSHITAPLTPGTKYTKTKPLPNRR